MRNFVACGGPGRTTHAKRRKAPMNAFTAILSIFATAAAVTLAIAAFVNA
jgi:hypothetical protein